MRILIADDEYLVRSSLRSMLEELNVPVDFVGEATNGEELVMLVGQSFPDVAFVDIRMPRLNGLEAIRNGRRVSPHTRWYILTGFPEFDYAQEAIRLGVAGYLLKPVKPEELQKVLAEFAEESCKQKATQNKQFENELVTLNYGLTTLEFEKPENILSRARFVGAIFCIDSYLSEEIKAQRQFEFCRALREFIENFSDNHNRIALFFLPSGELTTVGAWEPTRDYGARQGIRAYFKAVEQSVRNSSTQDLAITLLLSRGCLTYHDLQASLERLQGLSPLRVVSGIGRKLDVALLGQQAEHLVLLQFGNLVLNLTHSFQEGNYLNYTKALQDLEKYMSRSKNAALPILPGVLFDFINHSIDFPPCRPTRRGALDLHAPTAWRKAAKRVASG